jgi:hypothetical protein
MLKTMSPSLIITFAAIIIITVAGYYYQNRPAIADGEIGLQIGVPAQHEIAPLNKIFILPIVLQLTNKTGADVELTATNSCKIFRYIITRIDETFIQASGQGKDCTARPVSDLIEADTVMEDIQQIALDADRFKPGTHILSVRFWGYDATSTIEFTLPDYSQNSVSAPN